MRKQNKKPDFQILCKTYFCFSLMFIVFYYLLSAATNAQFSLPNVGDVKPSVSLNSDPLTPLPNSTITVTANISGIIGGGSSSYDWFLNNAKQSEASGLNKNTLTFKTGAIGSIYKISVRATTPNGGNLYNTISLTTSDVDLTWGADSQAPAAYRAKLMPTQNSIVTLSALPFIYIPGTKIQIGSNNLLYNWIIDSKLDSLKSGVGKNSYFLRVNNFFGNSYSVRLEVKTTDGIISLDKFLTIPVAKPQIWLYSYDSKTNKPLGTALKDVMTKSTDLNFIAQAYFFTVPAKNLKWQWFVNDERVNNETDRPWLATLNLNDFSGAFSAVIKTSATNTNNDLETGESTINLEIK